MKAIPLMLRLLLILTLALNGLGLAVPAAATDTRSIPAEYMSECGHMMASEEATTPDPAPLEKQSPDDCCKQAGCDCDCSHAASAVTAFFPTPGNIAAFAGPVAMAIVAPRSGPAGSRFRPPIG